MMKQLRYLFILFLLLCAGEAKADLYNSMKTFNSALLSLENRYVDTVDVDALTEIAIKAMLKELDPHSTYLSPKEVEQMNEGLGGSFEGIGVRYQMENDTLLVINTVSGGPSEKVGILAGDRIIMVGDSTIAGQKFNTNEIQRRLRGPKGSVVDLGILRQGESQLLWFKVERDKIPVYSIDASYIAAPGVGYIRLSRFAQTTPEDFDKAMGKLDDQGMKHLIIDLQDNGGGYLSSAVDLANFLLPSSELVVYTEGRSDGHRNYLTRHVFDHFKGRVVVLINEQSASASEILAGCLQDLDRGVIVGRRSFGKGLVQSPIRLSNGGMIRLTISHYYTPSGRCIQKPYTKGDQKSYNEDLLKRFKQGELQNADSIDFADSLKYYTRNGRTVYGGGGIMPDFFVPLDTLSYTKAHRAVNAKGSLNRYVIQYFKAHQQELHKQYPTIEAFLNEETGFKVSDEMVGNIIEQARKDSAQSNELETLYTNDVFRSQIAAYLANDLYEQGAYSRIMNHTSDVFKEAMDIINDERRYNELLKSK